MNQRAADLTGKSQDDLEGLLGCWLESNFQGCEDCHEKTAEQKDFFIALVRVRMPALQILSSLIPNLILAQSDTISTRYIFEA